MSFQQHHTSFSQTVIRDHFSSTATYSLIVHQLPLMNERPGNFAHSFQPPAQCQYRWLPPAGGYSICHFSLSSFVVLLLPASLTCHVWCLHIAGGFLFQLRQSPVCGTLSVGWIECDSNNATLFLPFIACCGEIPSFVAPPKQGQMSGAARKHHPWAGRDSGYPLTCSATLLVRMLKKTVIILLAVTKFVISMLMVLYILDFSIWQSFVKHVHGSLFVLCCPVLRNFLKVFK